MPEINKFPLLKKLPIFRSLLNEINQRDQIVSSLTNEISTIRQSASQKENELQFQIDQLQQERNESFKFAYPGHYYSPIPSIPEIQKVESRIWGNIPSQLPAIDLNTEEQLHLLKNFTQYYNEIFFPAEKQENSRYYYNNDFYPFTDGAILYSMMRHLKPRRIIEIGSGFSSAIMMDVNDRFFNGQVKLDFIEPYPDRLISLMKEADQKRYAIHQQFIQNIDLEIFSQLEENDILFIDSSHVSKIDSDVNKILFEILPILKKGVFIHFHDLFYPFEYHKEWVYKGVVWNEAYMLRAFLQFNQHFQIAFWNTYLYRFYKQSFIGMPKCMEGPGGNIWIKKVL